MLLSSILVVAIFICVCRMSDTAVLAGPGEYTLPKVHSYALAPTTKKMKRDIKAILASVYAESDAAIAMEEAELHETCPTCNHTKTHTKVDNAQGETCSEAGDPHLYSRSAFATDPLPSRSGGRPIGSKRANKIIKKAMGKN
jgi:hypothetical protein